jgi:hypothetical protein
MEMEQTAAIKQPAAIWIGSAVESGVSCNSKISFQPVGE